MKHIRECVGVSGVSERVCEVGVCVVCMCVSERVCDVCV